ncbi:hypothetical protein EGI20_09225 [Aquitalea sp. S1-19]|nr:hypothetical protein [Aquitalea sp. S1-19]
MRKNKIAFAGEATGLPAINPNALHMAKRDAQLSALRMLRVMRWHLDAHAHQAHGDKAAAAFAGTFFGVFGDCTAADVFIASLIEQCPALIEQLERETACR